MHWVPEPWRRTIRRGYAYEDERLRRTNIVNVLAKSLHCSRSIAKTLDPNINYISMMGVFGWYPYGHFFDSVQRLFRSLQQVPKPWMILHSDQRGITDFEQHMALLGVGTHQLLCISEPVIVPNLWISPLQAAPTDMDPSAYEWIYNCYVKGVSKKRRYRLYLSRNHVRQGTRGVTNEDAVINLLSEYDFTTVKGNESLDKIIEMFYNADVVVGPHGSLMVNTMFCQSHTRIVDYCPLTRPDYTFQHKHKRATDFRMCMVSGDHNHNIAIPLADLRCLLSSL